MRALAPLGVLIGLLTLCSCGGKETGPPTAPAQTPELVQRAEPAAKIPQTPTPAPAKIDPWPTYHGPSTLDGASAATLPETLTRVWRADVGAPIANPPVVGAGLICVADTKGGIHALDLAGKPVWNKTFTMPSRNERPPAPLEFDAPLALFDSTLIACSAAGRIYALDAANGNVHWERNMDFPILGTPNAAEVEVDGKPQKRLFVIDQSEGSLQCLDFANGTPLWKGKEVARCDGSAAVNGAMAVYGSCAGAVHIFSTVDGKLLREVPLDEDSQVAGGVVLLGDSVYSGSRSGKFIHANVQTGAVVWSNTDCEGEAFSTPAVNGDLVVFTANDSIVYALDRKSGALRWKQKLLDTASSPVIAGDKIVATAGGTVYLLNLADGKKLWSYPVSDEVTSPSLAGTLVIVGAEDGALTAFGRKVEGQ